MLQSVITRSVAAVALVVPFACAQSSFSVEGDLVSRYVWRGFTYGNGAAFQPSVSYSARGVTLAAWSNMPLAREPQRGRFNQIFFSAGTEREWRSWKLEGTLQGYHWQGAGGEGGVTTLELAGRVSRAVRSVRLFTEHTVDVANYRGSYFVEGGSEWERQTKRLQWQVRGVIGGGNARFNAAYAGLRQSAVNYAQAGVSAKAPLRRNWYLRPHAEITGVLDGAIRGPAGSGNVFSAGVAAGF
ncbi:MAG: hypothetical protein U0Q16_36275 [Bryobacteraceae bacterium]